MPPAKSGIMPMAIKMPAICVAVEPFAKVVCCRIMRGCSRRVTSTYSSYHLGSEIRHRIDPLIRGLGPQQAGRRSTNEGECGGDDSQAGSIERQTSGALVLCFLPAESPRPGPGNQDRYAHEYAPLEQAEGGDLVVDSCVQLPEDGTR